MVVVGSADGFGRRERRRRVPLTPNGSGGYSSDKLIASDAAAGDDFGIAVAVAGDTIAVGARADDTVTGPAYLFDFPRPRCPVHRRSASRTARQRTATVTWTAPASTGGSPLTGYVVTPFIAGVAQTPVTFTTTATSQMITGLTNGTTYTFKVAATNVGRHRAAISHVEPGHAVHGSPQHHVRVDHAVSGGGHPGRRRGTGRRWRLRSWTVTGHRASRPRAATVGRLRDPRRGASRSRRRCRR